MTLLIVLLCIALLVLLITWAKFNPFLAFLLISIFAGIILGIPLPKIIFSIQKGIGDTMGTVVTVIILGSMFGKLIAESGAAQKIASAFVETFHTRHIQWAMMIAGFVIGIPLFYNVGFVLMIPLIFSVVYQYKLPAVYVGLPMLAALSVTHGFLPPHPSPLAIVAELKANMGLTLFYGIIVALPAVIIAGPIYSKFLVSIKSEPLQIFLPKKIEAHNLPGTGNSFITALLPVILLMFTTILQTLFVKNNPALYDIIRFAGDPVFVMLFSLLIATYSLGLFLKMKIKDIMNIYSDSVKDVALILLIIAGAGALKQIFTDSGVSIQLGNALQSWPIHPLILGWMIAAFIRVCIGSATIAGLTTAGIIAPLLLKTSVDPNLMVLSIGAGSLMFSHVNDMGFWMFKEYFNLSIKDTIRSWSVMESIVSTVGLLGILLLNCLL
jgi:Gnt-I system high-affinity gluconate transporter